MKNRLETWVLIWLAAGICFIVLLRTQAQESATNKVPSAEQAVTNQIRELTNSKPKHLSEFRAPGEAANHAYEQSLVKVVLAKWKELERDPRFYYSLEPKEITATFRLHPDAASVILIFPAIRTLWPIYCVGGLSPIVRHFPSGRKKCVRMSGKIIGKLN